MTDIATVAPEALSLDDPKLYVNRELSWLEFNQRVLDEAHDASNPLMERVKFLAISANNLDEFFEVRVSGLMQQVEARNEAVGPDGLTPAEQLVRISERAHKMVAEQYACWEKELLPALNEQNIEIHAGEPKLTATAQAFLDTYFQEELEPVLTPITVDPAHPFPYVANKALCLAALLEGRDTDGNLVRSLGVVTVPRLLKRVIPIPSKKGKLEYIMLAAAVRRRLDQLFRGYKIVATGAFRVTRNSNLYLEEEEVENLLMAIENEVRQRRRGDVVRLEIEHGMAPEILERLRENLHVTEQNIYRVHAPVNLNRLMRLYNEIQRHDLRDKPFTPVDRVSADDSESLFAAIRKEDVLLHHPYDSFSTVLSFIQSAARDPNVVAIKQTLYRTNEDSPIIGALCAASEAGKQVTVVVEIKARFDEESNIRWARRLENAGVQVTYGLVGLKTHCKLCLLVRREKDGMRRYAHLGTGNYNPTTAATYTDLSLLTANPAIADDVAEVFNVLTARSLQPDIKKLLVAPFEMLPAFMRLIEREAQHAKAGKPARIIAKVNALIDVDIMRALYSASQAGVKIDLIVRGICGLRPGLEGVSENITVRSVVGRFLEHSRVFHFENGGEPEVFLGSADWMPRNLRGRVEVAFPIEDARLKARVRDEILGMFLSDNVKARELLASGAYRVVKPAEGAALVNAQEAFMKLARQNSPSESMRRPTTGVSIRMREV
ncbi:MAG: polyphosphate kinase 1 [Planctomycetes bacterium]|jgi:polyphosphate kinase|nr:polyphosphate kinase 1 [Planctomycetota bacterium]